MREIIISSENRLSGTPEDFQIDFDSKGTQMKLLEASIPISFTNILGGSFNITGTTSGLNTITLDTNRYSINTLADHIKAQLTSVIVGQLYTVTAGQSSELIIASSTEQFSLDFSLSTLTIGFSGITPVAPSQTGTSLSSILQVASHILICSNDIRGIDNGTTIAGTSTHHILHAVPLCGSGIANYRSSKISTWIKITKPITGFYLAFPNGFVVDLKGSNYAFKLLIEI